MPVKLAFGIMSIYNEAKTKAIRRKKDEVMWFRYSEYMVENSDRYPETKKGKFQPTG